MKHFVTRSLIASAALLFASTSSAQAQWANGSTRISSVYAIQGHDLVQFVIDNAGHGSLVNQNCEIANGNVVLQLDVPTRSEAEQQLLLDSILLAFMTNRLVKLRIRTDICSDVTGDMLRVVTGVQVFY